MSSPHSGVARVRRKCGRNQPCRRVQGSDLLHQDDRSMTLCWCTPCSTSGRDRVRSAATASHPGKVRGACQWHRMQLLLMLCCAHAERRRASVSEVRAWQAAAGAPLPRLPPLHPAHGEQRQLTRAKTKSCDKVLQHPRCCRPQQSPHRCRSWCGGTKFACCWQRFVILTIINIISDSVFSYSMS